VAVKPDTFIRWHRQGFRRFWRLKSKPTGRPPLPKDLRRLIRKLAAENLTWGVEHVTNKLNLRLGIRVSPRTVEQPAGNSTLEQVEREHVIRLLRETAGVISKAAARLGMPRTTLNALMRKLGISRKDL